MDSGERFGLSRSCRISCAQVENVCWYRGKCMFVQYVSLLCMLCFTALFKIGFGEGRKANQSRGFTLQDPVMAHPTLYMT